MVLCIRAITFSKFRNAPLEHFLLTLKCKKQKQTVSNSVPDGFKIQTELLLNAVHGYWLPDDIKRERGRVIGLVAHVGKLAEFGLERNSSHFNRHLTFPGKSVVLDVIMFLRTENIYNGDGKIPLLNRARYAWKRKRISAKWISFETRPTQLAGRVTMATSQEDGSR